MSDGAADAGSGWAGGAVLHVAQSMGGRVHVTRSNIC
jgi:hypothetical protein